MPNTIEGKSGLTILSRNLDNQPQILARRAINSLKQPDSEPIYAASYLSDNDLVVEYLWHPDDTERRKYTFCRAKSGLQSVKVDFQRLAMDGLTYQTMARLQYDEKQLHALLLNPPVVITDGLSIDPCIVVFCGENERDAFHDSATVTFSIDQLLNAKFFKGNTTKLRLLDSPFYTKDAGNLRTLSLRTETHLLELYYPRQQCFWLDKLCKIQRAEYSDFENQHFRMKVVKIDPVL